MGLAAGKPLRVKKEIENKRRNNTKSQREKKRQSFYLWLINCPFVPQRQGNNHRLIVISLWHATTTP